MGRIGKILSFLNVTRNNAQVSDVKINPSAGDNITCEHFTSIGDDSQPLTSDYVITQEIPRTGGEAAIGYLDPKNTKKANAGDKRIYARSSGGTSVSEIWLKNDGTILLSNSAGNIELKPNGDIDLNGIDVTINSTKTTINATTKLTLNSPETEYSDGSGTIKHSGVSVDKNHIHESVNGVPTPLTSVPKN